MSVNVAVEAELTTQIHIGRAEVINLLADRWQELCDQTRCAPFHRPEWIAAYLQVFESDSEVVLLTASAGERLVAVLPLIRKKC